MNDTFIDRSVVYQPDFKFPNVDNSNSNYWNSFTQASAYEDLCLNSTIFGEIPDPEFDAIPFNL